LLVTIRFYFSLAHQSATIQNGLSVWNNDSISNSPYPSGSPLSGLPSSSFPLPTPPLLHRQITPTDPAHLPPAAAYLRLRQRRVALPPAPPLFLLQRLPLRCRLPHHCFSSSVSPSPSDIDESDLGQNGHTRVSTYLYPQGGHDSKPEGGAVGCWGD
jgi:hypothetical protein